LRLPCEAAHLEKLRISLAVPAGNRTQIPSNNYSCTVLPRDAVWAPERLRIRKINKIKKTTKQKQQVNVMVQGSKKRSNRPSVTVRVEDKRPQAKPRKPQRIANPRSTAGPRDKNAYAASLLNPEGVKDAKIPDESTIPSITMQTSNKHLVRTTNGGEYYACIKPSVLGGIYQPRISPAGELKMQNVNAGADVHDPGWEKGEFDDILTATQIESFTNICAAIRPVSMSVRYIPTEAAMTAQGLGGTGVYSGQSFPAHWDSPNSQPLGITDPTSLFFLDNDLAPASMTEALTSMKTEVNAMAEFATYWGPEDNGDFEYRGLEAVAYTAVGSADLDYASFALQGWANMYWFEDDGLGGYQTVNYTTPFNYTTAPGGDQIGTPGFQIPGAPVPQVCELPVFTDNDMSLPWVAVLFTGASPSTVLGELIITINWEAIPNQSVLSVMPGQPSPFNPEELAQATNLIRHLPETVTNVVNDPNTKIRLAAMQSTTDLYDPAIPRKRAVEGTSFFDRVKKFASKIDWSLVAGAGKALLSFL
jgi:hypothetical protein